MDSSKLVIKFFVQAPSTVHPESFVPVFHSWIQTHAVDDHLLIDVADYQHVPDGPGTVLVSHEANFYMDRHGGRLGLSYWRKQPLIGSFTDRLRFTFAAALKACVRLEEDEHLNGLRFRTDEIAFRINDRLLAPNTRETFDAIREELENFLNALYGSRVQLEFSPSPKELFEVRIKASDSPQVTALLDRLVTSAHPRGTTRLSSSKS